MKIENEILTIFGANGSGKTTLLKILSTLIRPSLGKIFIDDLGIEHDGMEIRKKIGFVAHETYLYDELTALENLRFYSKIYNMPKIKFENKVYDLLKDFRLLQRKNDYVRVFSRGMKQRLSIARALLHEPTILLLDEPYTGLDQKAVGILDDFLFKSMGKKTIIMTSHNIEKLMISNRIAILAKGKIVYDEKSKNLDLEKFRKIYKNLEGSK